MTTLRKNQDRISRQDFSGAVWRKSSGKTQTRRQIDVRISERVVLGSCKSRDNVLPNIHRRTSIGQGIQNPECHQDSNLFKKTKVRFEEVRLHDELMP